MGKTGLIPLNPRAVESDLASRWSPGVLSSAAWAPLFRSFSATAL
jgi:hypothetical protein